MAVVREYGNETSRFILNRKFINALGIVNIPSKFLSWNCRFVCSYVCWFVAREGINQFASDLFLKYWEENTGSQTSGTKSVLSLIPGGDGSFSTKAKHGRRIALGKKLLLSARGIQVLKSRTHKLSSLRAAVKMLG